MDELRILLLEDNPSDAELLEYQLRKGGLVFSALRVDTEPAFQLALSDFKPDIVLADYNLPSYNGRAALDYIQQVYPDIPVVMVTGAIGEEKAVELLRSGARDYLLKDRLTRLSAAIQRALDEQEKIRTRRESEQRLREAESKFRTLFEAANDGIFLLDATGFVDCNQRGADMYGRVKRDIIGHSPAEFCPEKQPDGRLSTEVAAEKIQAALRGETQHFEWRSLCSDNTPFDVDINLNGIELGGQVYLQAVVRDITGRKQVEQALRASESRFRLLVENAPLCIHEIGLDGRISSMNRAGLSMMGVEHECQVQGFLYLDAVCDADRERIAELLASAYTGEASHFEFKASGVREQFFKSCFVPIRDQDGAVGKLMGITEDITERKQAEKQIHSFAFYDALTQLPNRRLLLDRMGQAMLASKRNGRYAALMFLDLDNFKPLNDTHGHDVGDLLLIEAARRISSCVRAVDTVARFGGDEFVVMLSELDADKELSVAMSNSIAEKIRAILEEPYLLAIQSGGEIKNTVEHRCTSSIGVVLFINHEASPEDILKCADLAMYQAKEGGRNTIRFFDPLSGEDGRVTS
ncbi:MAG: diguanylate cyclase [Gallionella sp.]|nr:diguanylate cyclase [Gallionella sp.]